MRGSGTRSRSRSRSRARRAQEKSTFRSIQEESADAKVPAGLLPAAPPSDAESATPGVEARCRLAARFLVYSSRSCAISILKWGESPFRRVCPLHLVGFCPKRRRRSPSVLHSLSQKCGATDGYCNNAHLLLPSPTWTSNHSAVPPPPPLPLPSPPLPPFTLCCIAALCQIGRRTTLRYRSCLRC